MLAVLKDRKLLSQNNVIFHIVQNFRSVGVGFGYFDWV